MANVRATRCSRGPETSKCGSTRPPPPSFRRPGKTARRWTRSQVRPLRPSTRLQRPPRPGRRCRSRSSPDTCPPSATAPPDSCPPISSGLIIRLVDSLLAFHAWTVPGHFGTGGRRALGALSWPGKKSLFNSAIVFRMFDLVWLHFQICVI